MPRLTLFSLVTASVLFAFNWLPAHADEPKTLRVIGYNVQFLPGLGKLFNQRGNDDYRPHALGKVLRDYDVVCLSEVFEHHPRKIILDELRSAWGERFHVYETPDPGPEVGRYNAGLTIASRYPIVASHHIAYSAWSTKKEFGVFADEFAAKGALHARIRIDDANPPFEIDVFDTHLDSKLESARAVQFEELATLAGKQMSPDRPAMFLGDFNIRGNPKSQSDPDSEYQKLMARLRKARPDIVDGWVAVGEGEGGTSDQEKAGGGSRIDYIFFAPTAKPRLDLKSVTIRPFLDPKVTALSDHSAVDAVFDRRP